MNILDLVKFLDAKPSSGGWIAKCPAHDDKNPSLSFTERDGKLLFHCHAGCPQNTVLEKIREITDRTSISQSRQIHQYEKIWAESLPLTEGPFPCLDKYIEHRGLSAVLPDSLRFNPSLYFSNAEKHECLVALVQRKEFYPVGIHRIYLKDGKKAAGKESKKSLGNVSGNAVYLSHPDKILAVTEGIETGLAIYQSTGIPTACTLTCGSMSKYDPPSSIETVHVFADNDISLAGQNAARSLADRLILQGITVYLHIPEVENSDFLDVLSVSGAAYFHKLIANARPLEKPIHPSMVRLSNVVSEKVEFLFEPYLPKGKLTIFCGNGGVGKSTVSLKIAALVSNGEDFDGKKTRDPQTVLIFNAEDGIADTIKPRLEANGADSTKIFAYTEFMFLDESGLEVFKSIVTQLKPGLIIVDPIQSFFDGSKDMNRSNHIRAVLSPLIKIAQDFDVAILIIAHMNKDSGKNPLHRINGSVDIGAAVRSVLSVEKIPDDPDSQVIFHTKSNLAKKGVPIGYRIKDGVIEWFDGSQYSSEDFFGDERSNREKFSAVEEASEFLSSILRNGPLSFKTILQEATVLEISAAALKRSKKTLGIISTQQWTNGKKGGGDFLWSLPDSVSQPNGLELNHQTDFQDIM
jgi:hypothetical protein